MVVSNVVPGQPAVTEGCPRGDVFDPPPRHLPTRRDPGAPGWAASWFFVAAHGGSGASLLARLSYVAAGESECYGMAAGRAWPNPELERTVRVVVVARTSMYGLSWARDVARQYLAAAAPPGVELLGLVVVGDAPGRLPRPAAGAARLLRGVYPRVWSVPWVPAYRVLTGLPTDACPPIHPAIDRALDGIRAVILDPRGDPS